MEAEHQRNNFFPMIRVQRASPRENLLSFKRRKLTQRVRPELAGFIVSARAQKNVRIGLHGIGQGGGLFGKASKFFKRLAKDACRRIDRRGAEGKN